MTLTPDERRAWADVQREMEPDTEQVRRFRARADLRDVLRTCRSTAVDACVIVAAFVGTASFVAFCVWAWDAVST